MSSGHRGLNRLIPVAVKAMPFQAHGGDLHAGRGDDARMTAAMQF
jgi:hypothetical protein